jgi:hypothetical protein
MDNTYTTYSNAKQPEPLSLEELTKVFSAIESYDAPRELVIIACIKHAKKLKKQIAESHDELNPLLSTPIRIHVRKYLKKIRVMKVPAPVTQQKFLPSLYDPLPDFIDNRERTIDLAKTWGWY